jgi:hypothetical protein
MSFHTNVHFAQSALSTVSQLPFNKYKVSFNHAEFHLSVHSHIFDTLLGAFSKLPKVTISFVMAVSLYVHLSASPHGLNQLPLDGFS